MIMNKQMTPLINKFRSFPDQKIIYKRVPERDAVIVKPNTFRWRLSYWWNQLLNDITMLVMKPIYYRWYSWWRLDEADDIMTGVERAYRKDIVVYTVDGLNLGFKLSPRILANAEWVKDKFKQIRWISSKERTDVEYKNSRQAYVAGHSKGWQEGYDMAKAERNDEWETRQITRMLIKLFADKFGVGQEEIVKALKEEDGIK